MSYNNSQQNLAALHTHKFTHARAHCWSSTLRATTAKKLVRYLWRLLFDSFCPVPNFTRSFCRLSYPRKYNNNYSQRTHHGETRHNKTLDAPVDSSIFAGDFATAAADCFFSGLDGEAVNRENQSQRKPRSIMRGPCVEFR